MVKFEKIEAEKENFYYLPNGTVLPSQPSFEAYFKIDGFKYIYPIDFLKHLLKQLKNNDGLGLSWEYVISGKTYFIFRTLLKILPNASY